ncbi:MAG: hypothetical protein MI862_19750 [Desulfobacterales bacterium]|nr:hypothetical protein [Desulfobacterales bacterium]
MSLIRNEFKRAFVELENGYKKLKETVNRYTETGPELEKRLVQTLIRWYPKWLQLTGELWQLDQSFSSYEKKKHREYVCHSHLVRLFKEAPYYERIITKPRGYAGDAEMMNIIYRNRFEGKSPFAKLVHKQAVSCDACRAVRNRKVFLKREILKKGKGRVLSLAAGPAREIIEILEQRECKKGYEFLALDHDIQTIRDVTSVPRKFHLPYALANAFHLLKGNFNIAYPRPWAISRCDPARDFSGWRQIASPLIYRLAKLKKNHYDLVYSAGLYDYIEAIPNEDNKGAIALTRSLFELVRPGGTLVVGNFNTRMPPDIRFVMEFICDWNLIYRDKSKILSFVRAIPESEIKGQPEILSEPEQLNYFLKVEKVQI